MNVAVFLRELKLNRTMFLVWALSIAAMVFVILAIMPTILASSAVLKEFLSSSPIAVMKGFSVDVTTFTEPLAYYASYSMLYTVLLGGMFSISVTSRTLHREQAERTAEFLLVRPISRGTIFASKLAAWLVLVAAMNALVLGASVLGLALFAPKGSSWSLTRLAVLAFYGVAFMLAVGGCGLLASAFARRLRSLTGPAIGIVLAMYLVDVISKIASDYEDAGWVSPFRWVDIGVTRADYGLAWWRVALFLGLILITIAPAWLIWRKKDILA